MEREGIIKQRINSNLTISLDRRSSLTNSSTVDINSITNEQFPLQNSTKILNVVQVGTPQSSLIVDLLRENSRPLDWLKMDHQMTLR
jgi:hypothetical protein